MKAEAGSQQEALAWEPVMLASEADLRHSEERGGVAGAPGSAHPPPISSEHVGATFHVENEIK